MNGEYFEKTLIEVMRIVIQIHQIRSSREQYLILVKTVKEDSQDQDQSATGKVSFKAFDGLEPLQFNPYTDPEWQEAVESFNSSMNYVDQRTAQILKLHLRQAQSNPRQV